MSNDAGGATSSDGGVTGPHPQPSPFNELAAPTTSDDFSRVTPRLIPIACWNIEDIRFAFDSSFVTPDAAVELQALKDLREAHSQAGPVYPPLSIFGHADPVGPQWIPTGTTSRSADGELHP